MPVRRQPPPPFGRLLGRTACGWLLMAAAATASEMIGPLPPPSPPPPAPREPLASVSGEFVRPAACNACRGECQGGTCPANCPVRPDEFGFYETEWRTWPTAMSRQPAAPETLTPSSPPKSEVPGANEESLRQPTAAEDEVEAEAAPLPAPRIPVPDRRPATDAAERPAKETAERPAKETEERPAKEAEEPPAAAPKAAPEKLPPNAPTEEENLFDEAHRRLPRAAVLAIANQKAARHRSAASPEPAMATEGLVLVGHEETAEPEADRGGNPLRGSVFQSTNPLR